MNSSVRDTITKAIVGLALLGLSLGGCAASTTERLNLPPLETVPHVELERYLGTWYEIASYPQSFQEGCTATTATYSLLEDGDIRVLNQCRKGSLDGELDSADGLARVTDTTTNAKLEVSFFRPFWGDYWIIDLGAQYEYAVVGHPGRDYLWILSRTPSMEPTLYNEVLERIESMGYPLDRLRETLQRVESSPAIEDDAGEGPDASEGTGTEDAGADPVAVPG